MNAEIIAKLAQIAQTLEAKDPVFSCQECGKKFKTVKAAEKAQSEGCPKCGGSDIDLAEGKKDVQQEEDEIHQDGEPGESEAENVTDIFDTLDFYLDDIHEDIYDRYDVTDEEAMDLMFEGLDQAVEEGLVPEFPQDEDPKTVAIWLGKAKSVGLEAYILAYVESRAE